MISQELIEKWAKGIARDELVKMQDEEDEFEIAYSNGVMDAIMNLLFNLEMGEFTYYDDTI